MNRKSLIRLLKLIVLLGAGTLLAYIAQRQFPRYFWLILVLSLTFSCFILVLLWLGWYLEESTPRKDFIDIFIKIASPVLVLASLVLAWLSFQNTQLETSKNLELSQAALENSRAEQRSQRFIEALEKLGGDTVHKRLAGVYGFQKLDSDFKINEGFYEGFYKEWKGSAESQTLDVLTRLDERRKIEIKEHGAIMEILTNFIRSQVPWPNAPSQAAPETKREDVFQILKYMSQRKLTFGRGEQEGLNLTKADLRGYVLNKTLSDNCNDLNASEVNFERVNFNEANLENIELRCAKLKGATFWNANLKDAKLNHADLTDVDLTGTHLEGANMDGATVNQERLDDAIIDGKTRCPAGFRTEPEPDGTESYKCVKT